MSFHFHFFAREGSFMKFDKNHTSQMEQLNKVKKKMAQATGIEPATCRLTADRSTN